MILIVSYDLKSARDYTTFYEALKREGSWWHYLASTWLISTEKSPAEVAAAVRPYMEPADFLLVTEMGKLHQGYLPKPAWDWIAEHQTPQSPVFAPFGEYTGGIRALSGLAGLGSPGSKAADTGSLLDTARGEKPKMGQLSDLLGGKPRSPWHEKK